MRVSAAVLIAVLLTSAFGAAPLWAGAGAMPGSWAATADQCQGRMVKVYGAGGLRGLEAYQSGFLISATGHVLTVWSYVLDTDYITVVLGDGRKFEAKLLGADPKLETAVLKIEAEDLPHFDLAASQQAEVGSRVLAFSNLFGVAAGDEPSSVQHGSIAAITQLDARRGTFETPYHGPVYVIDAITNNPGAAGGALTDRSGQLVGMLGKELRNAQNSTWLNYAIPIAELRGTVQQILAGKVLTERDERLSKPDHPLRLTDLGIVLVPDVLERTPPYVDSIYPGSPAAKAGVRSDDLVVYVGQHLVPSRRALADELAAIEAGGELKLVLMRGQELVEVQLKTEAPEETP